MSNKPLYFELASIALLLAVGVFLLLTSLPGWGLISIAGLLSVLSFVLRKLAKSSTTATAALLKGKSSNAS